MTGDAYNYISTAVFTLVIIIMVQFVCVIYNLIFFFTYSVKSTEEIYLSQQL